MLTVSKHAKSAPPSVVRQCYFSNDFSFRGASVQCAKNKLGGSSGLRASLWHCQLGDRSVALDGGQGHLRLEGRQVVPAGSSAHGLSCSRRSSPLSGRNSTYRPVQISGTSSEDKVTAFLINWHNRLARLGTPSEFVTLPMLRQDIA